METTLNVYATLLGRVLKEFPEIDPEREFIVEPSSESPVVFVSLPIKGSFWTDYDTTDRWLVICRTVARVLQEGTEKDLNVTVELVDSDDSVFTFSYAGAEEEYAIEEVTPRLVYFQGFTGMSREALVRTCNHQRSLSELGCIVSDLMEFAEADELDVLKQASEAAFNKIYNSDEVIISNDSGVLALTEILFAVAMGKKLALLDGSAGEFRESTKKLLQEYGTQILIY